MSIMPASAQSHLSTYQLAALEQQSQLDASLISGATAGPAASGDALFVSLDAQVALQQFELTATQPASSTAQASDATLLTSLGSSTPAPNFGFTQVSQESALLQYQAAALQAVAPQVVSNSISGSGLVA